MNNKKNQERGLLSHAFMDECPLFKNWSQAEKLRLAESAKDFYWQPEQIIFDRGDISRWLFLIVSGSVKGVVLKENGDQAIIDLAGRGNLFGGLSIVDNKPHLHSAVAIEATHCIGFDSAIIQSVLDQNPSLYREIAVALSSQLRSTFIWLEESLLRSVKQRVYIRLQQIAADTGTPHEGGMLIQPPISQDALAAMMGVTRQTLNKELGELKKSGLVQKLGNKYWVKDNNLNTP